MKISVLVIEYITNGGKEAIGVVQLQPDSPRSSCFRVHPCQLNAYRQELSMINGIKIQQNDLTIYTDGKLRVTSLEYKQPDSNMGIYEDDFYAAGDEDIENVEDDAEVGKLVDNVGDGDQNDVECE